MQFNIWSIHGGDYEERRVAHVIMFLQEPHGEISQKTKFFFIIFHHQHHINGPKAI
jgi:hypothetical protein